MEKSFESRPVVLAHLVWLLEGCCAGSADYNHAKQFPREKIIRRRKRLTQENAATLGDVARAVGGKLSGGEAGTVVSDVTHDSRQVRAGWLFVAIRGEKLDAHRFVAEVTRQGAVGVVSERERTEDFGGAWIQVADARRALALAAAEVHRHPSRELKLVGITGTNGKTTTAFLVAAIAEAAGERTALISTVEYRVAGEREEALHTT